MRRSENVQVSRWKVLDVWDKELAGLTWKQLQDRLKLARKREVESDRKGIGRSPRARHFWKQRREAVEAELERRGLSERR